VCVSFSEQANKKRSELLEERRSKYILKKVILFFIYKNFERKIKID
jgi:hypothetical protein